MVTCVIGGGGCATKSSTFEMEMGWSGVRVGVGKKALQKNFVQQKSTRFKKPLDVLKSNGYVVKC